MSGRRAGGQEAAGGAEINEKAQNEKKQQLETLEVTSGTEPEKTTLLSHLLRHYNEMVMRLSCWVPRVEFQVGEPLATHPGSQPLPFLLKLRNHSGC